MIRKVFFSIVFLLLFCNCKGRYLELPQYIETESLELKVLDFSKMSNYYLLKTETLKKDTIFVVSYIKNKNNLTNPNSRKSVWIKKEHSFDFELIKINEQLVNGVPNIRNIIIEKDTLWSNNVGLEARLFTVKPKIYQALNTVGLKVFKPR
ncbi:hypothetical protein [Flavobacterium sp. NKUCC04_CG]|uniref:hypothetical protein n=1 Tax=Flavobacterium sp. NKUCC04_CG TaxID=2842121 RepID=UPI001C5AA903|nr:hypothetical protein [Flavobacterium sp. NKUCC04_CG]MBW3520170.1 hypothetical protein [Flavobacterium sp. NKUCC04_CG]